MAFPEEVKKITKGGRVNVFVSTTAVDYAHQATMKSLAPFGRFFCVGNRHDMNSTNLSKEAMLKNITFSASDIDDLLQLQPDLSANLLRKGAELYFSQGLPQLVQSFAISDTNDAVKAVAASSPSSKKVVLKLHDESLNVLPSSRKS